MIKKLFGLVALLAFAALPARSQGIEFSAGVNFSKLSGSVVSDAVRDAGKTFGIDLVIPIGPIGLNLGGSWSQKGVEQTIDNAASIIDLTYIELPVHLRFPLVGAGPIRLNLILGPTLGINTGCEITPDAGVAQDCTDLAGGFDAKGLEWSGTGGLGLSFRLGGLAYAGVELTYAVGLTSVDEAAPQSLKNRTFTLAGHFGFDVF